MSVDSHFQLRHNQLPYRLVGVEALEKSQAGSYALREIHFYFYSGQSFAALSVTSREAG